MPKTILKKILKISDWPKIKTRIPRNVVKPEKKMAENGDDGLINSGCLIYIL